MADRSKFLEGLQLSAGKGLDVPFARVERCGLETFKAELSGKVILNNPPYNVALDVTAFQALKYSIQLLPQQENPQL